MNTEQSALAALVELMAAPQGNEVPAATETPTEPATETKKPLPTDTSTSTLANGSQVRSSELESHRELHPGGKPDDLQKPSTSAGKLNSGMLDVACSSGAALPSEAVVSSTTSLTECPGKTLISIPLDIRNSSPESGISTLIPDSAMESETLPATRSGEQSGSMPVHPGMPDILSGLFSVRDNVVVPTPATGVAGVVGRQEETVLSNFPGPQIAPRALHPFQHNTLLGPPRIPPQRFVVPPKRPFDPLGSASLGGGVLPPIKKPRLDASVSGLPLVPIQPKVKPNSSSPSNQIREKLSEYVVSVNVRKEKSGRAFPGGRGVPSPTFGAVQRNLQSPLVDMNFTERMGTNRNPFRTSTHRPWEVYDYKRMEPSKPIVSALPSAPPINIPFMTKPDPLGLFDSAEGDTVPTASKKQKQKKKKSAVVHKRLPLDKVNFTSPKDLGIAKKILAGIHDLSAIIPMEEARWLGRNLWIFTVEQLEYSLSAVTSDGGVPGQELQREVALGSLVHSESEGKEMTGFIVSDKEEELGNNGDGEEETEAEAASEESRSDGDPVPPAFSERLSVSNKNEQDSSEAAKSVVSSRGDGGPIELSKRSEPFAPETTEHNIGALIEENPIKGASDLGEGLSPREDPVKVPEKTQQDTCSSADESVTSDVVHQGPSPLSERDGEGEETGSAVSPTLHQLELARAILDRWQECINRFKDGEVSAKEATGFPLSGPIGQLLPKLVRQFLETIRIQTLLSFFSLKKTEASPLMGYYKDWRSHCELKPLKTQILARHLLGMSYRLESAIRAMPPADEFARIWMSQVLIILTGSAKDFVIDELGIDDVQHFLDARTKEWSDRLVKWRNRNGLPPLKGSGKVAMVSGWKTSLKEAMDVEKGRGRVLTEAELLRTPFSDEGEDIESDVEFEESEKPKKKVAKRQSKTGSQASFESGESALSSEDFLGSVLRQENIDFLKTVGIRTAEQLIECEKQQSSSVILELVRYRTQVTAVQAQPATCVRLMYDWTQRVKNRLEEIESDTVKSLAKKRGPRPREDIDDETPSPEQVVKKQRLKVSRSKGTIKIFANAIDALSTSTRAFLDNINIRDADTFLATKTSVIANSYIEWREQENMVTLKGYGAIATVSGWKAQVRRAAIDAGKHESESTDPESQYPKGFISEGRPRVPARPTSFLEGLHPYPKTHPNLLFGIPKRQVYLRGPTGSTFVFELSVRTSSYHVSKSSVYLTYMGYHELQPGSPQGVRLHLGDLDPDSIPLLADVTDDWKPTTNDPPSSDPFSSAREGCGIIDLGRYGVLETPEDQSALLKSLIRSFLADSSSELPRSENVVNLRNKDDNAECVNVFRVGTPLGGHCHVFFQSDPLQKGQVVELRASGYQIPGDLRNFCNQDKCTLRRATIINEIGKLGCEDIENILSWTAGKTAIAQSTVLQRRFHWLASLLLNRFDDIEKEGVKNGQSLLTERAFLHKTGEPLLLKASYFQEIRSTEDPSTCESYQDLMKEAKEEISASLLCSPSRVSPSDSSVFCPLAMRVVEQCEMKLSSFLILKPQDSLQAQECLLADLLSCATAAAVNVLSPEASLEDLAIQKSTEHGIHEVLLATGSNNHMPIFRPIDDVSSGDAHLNRLWYVQYQILAAVHLVASCKQISWLNIPNPVYSYSILATEIEKQMTERNVLLLSLPPNWSLSSRFMQRNLFKGAGQVAPTPDSLPIFLGLVWRKLQGSYGWRLDAGESRSDIAYMPPGHKNRARRRHDRSAKLKQERLQKRAKLDMRLQQVGLGYIPKLTRRLVNASVDSESNSGQSTTSIENVLKKYGEYVLLKSPEGKDEDIKAQVSAIIEGITRCISKLLPLLDGGSDQEDIKSIGSEKLLQVLFVIPGVLQQSGLPVRQVEDSIAIIKDLIKYLTDNYEACFDEESRPLQEEYDDSEEKQDDFLSSKLASLLRRDSGGTKDEYRVQDDETLVRDLVQPSDLPDLTEFTAMAMQQMVPYRSTAADINKRGRRSIPVGYPGMLCKHCWGTNGEGKYFFTSPDSLSTAGGVVYSHLCRCTMFPPEDLKKLTALKVQVSEARKRLKFGAQAAYFNRLWKRLHNAKTLGTGGVFVVQTEDQGEAADQADDSFAADDKGPHGTQQKYFKSHFEVMEFIQKNPPWNSQVDIVEAVNLYYHALYHGGRIYRTSSHPRFFDAEWILAKVSPEPLHNTKPPKSCAG